MRVGWKAGYDRAGGAGEVAFEVIYLHATDAGPKILAYITGDEGEQLRALGLLDGRDQGGPPGG